MKRGFLLDEASAAAIGFDWLSSDLEPASEYGRRASASMLPFARGQEAQAQERARRAISLAGALGADRVDELRGELHQAVDITPIVARVEIGGSLDDADLLELQSFCDVAVRLGALLKNATATVSLDDAAAREVAAALEPGRTGAQGFYLADGFSPGLSAARHALQKVQFEFDAARGRLEQRVAQALQRADLSPEEFIVMRDAFTELPAGVRVLREAPTYVVCELNLDETALAALAERDAALHVVALAEAEARAALSAVVRSVAEPLTVYAQQLGELDELATRGRFALQYECTTPEIVDEAIVSFEQGRYLPLAIALEREGRAYTPIDLALDGVAVLTGPNMGGKSVALQTCGFLALCAAFGIPVPAKGARIGLFDEIAWLGIGADAELSGLLSSFAAEVVRLKSFTRDESRILMLADEFARGTSPHEGRALLIALIELLRDRGVRALLATHFSGVAAASGVRHLAVRGLRKMPSSSGDDLNAALNALGRAMDYVLIEVDGEAVLQSDAIALAEMLGLDATLIERARRILTAKA